jgi:Domain of unknown function (DUF4157)
MERLPPETRTTRPDGLPAQLRAGLESLSGQNLDDVRVVRGSSRPASVGALAYTQGNDIHLAPGQDQHLAHEAWHAVQQRQGRVTPTISVAGNAVNDDPALEHEADVMAARVSAMPTHSLRDLSG